MSSTVATRDLKTRLGRYMRLVKKGRTIVVTDRGRAFAEIRPIPRESDDEETVLETLAAQGVLTLPTKAPDKTWRPVAIKGRPLSETLLDLRGDRF